jgi:Uma2 family endonuclease
MAGGRSHVSEDDYLEGAPELIVEISSSSVSYDLPEKLRVYRRNGVQEYLVWRVDDKQIDWFQLRDEEYIRLAPDASGLLYSQVFPGLSLAVSPLLEGNLVEVLVELQKGLRTPEHAKFVAQLQSKEAL